MSRKKKKGFDEEIFKETSYYIKDGKNIHVLHDVIKFYQQIFGM